MITKKKFQVVVSHPIQYHAVLWRNLEQIDEIDFEVFFCSDHGQNVSLDKEFGVAFKWDLPLKDGYKSRTFKNLGFGNGFFKYINFSLLLSLLFSRNDIVYFHGVNNFTAFFAFWVSKLKGSKIIIRNIAHCLDEDNNSLLKFRLKDFIYGTVFRKSTYCLYIGKHNKAFYKSFRVKDSKLIHAPHVVDNTFFQSKILSPEKRYQLRESLGLEKDELVLLFCGKLIPIKQPKMLLEALSLAKFNRKVTLLFVGDGVLREELEAMSNKIKTANKEIKFLGFKNQTELPAIYSISDVLVLPSVRETWGLVVNEALNYSNAIIVSDHVGCAPDLVENKTGFVFNRNSVEKLKSVLEELVNDNHVLSNFKENGLKLINDWSVDQYIDTIKKIINEKY